VLDAPTEVEALLLLLDTDARAARSFQSGELVASAS